MFKRVKKKPEEDKIVDLIIQIYAEQNSIDSKLLDFINKQTRPDEKRELLASLDEYNTLLCEHPIFNKLKKQLFGTGKNLPVLTHMELSVCFLANTQKYYPEAIVDILWIDKERFRNIVESLESKMTKSGYRLPKSYKAMQPIIQAYCKNRSSAK